MVGGVGACRVELTSRHGLRVGWRGLLDQRNALMRRINSAWRRTPSLTYKCLMWVRTVEIPTWRVAAMAFGE